MEGKEEETLQSGLFHVTVSEGCSLVSYMSQKVWIGRAILLHEGEKCV